MSAYSNQSLNWLVAYTLPNSEKKINLKLQEQEIECFLPLHTVVKKWSDRTKKTDVPLFPGYIFIKSSLQRRFDLLYNRELVKFVSFEGVPAVIDDNVIESLKRIKEEKVEIGNYDGFQAGIKVRITEGHLSGAEGVLVRKNGKHRFIIHVEALNQAVYVEVPAANVEIVNETPACSSIMATC